MKWFNYILSIYLLVISCIPCMDEEPVYSFPSLTIASSHFEADTPIHAEDACSPLCICNCCSGVTLLPNTSEVLQTISIVFQEQFSIYKQINRLDLSYSIWQPPKLS